MKTEDGINAIASFMIKTNPPNSNYKKETFSSKIYKWMNGFNKMDGV
jgi:hypothetical protein